MIPDISQPPETLAEFPGNYLNLIPEFECGPLSGVQIADVAMLAMAHPEGYATTAHLVSLWGGLPCPSDEAGNFWRRLWRASGTAGWPAPTSPERVTSPEPSTTCSNTGAAISC